MSYSLSQRTAITGGYTFQRRNFSSYEQAEVEAERGFACSGTEYLIEDDRGPISYRVAR